MNINMEIPGLKGVIVEKIESLSSELKEAYELKELYKKWQNDAKNEKDLAVVKAGLIAFYRKIEEKRLKPLKIGK